MIGFFAMAQINAFGTEFLTGDIIKVIVRVKEHCRIIALSQVFYADGLSVAAILAGNMVGYKVDDNLEAGMMCALDERLKLGHSVLDIDGQVGAYVIVITYGIGRASLPLDHMRVAG